MWRRNSVMAVTAVVLATGGLLIAKEEKCHRLEAFAAKVGLNDQQKDEIRRLHADFHKKTAPVKEHLWALRHDQRESMRGVLTEEQRIAVRKLIGEHWNSKWQATAAKLDLSAEQKQRIDKVRETYGKLFHDVAAEKSSSGEHFRELRRAKYQAIGRELNEEQRAKLFSLVRKEDRSRHDSEARRQYWKGIGEKLGVAARAEVAVQEDS